ncbi:MAG: hypothetical protein K0R54_110 [Clostridiaceae bacterium]|nr:hypothetical protein [Clostridiaceae bacterium]
MLILKKYKEEIYLGDGIMYLQRFISWIIGIGVICVLLGVFIESIIEYVPYLVAGLAMATPFYGLYRKIGKYGHFITVGLKSVLKELKDVYKENKASVGIYIACFYIAVKFHKALLLMAFKTTIFTILGLCFMCITWMTIRTLLKIVKKVEILSFKEAIMGAL